MSEQHILYNRNIDYYNNLYPNDLTIMPILHNNITNNIQKYNIIHTNTQFKQYNFNIQLNIYNLFNINIVIKNQSIYMYINNNNTKQYNILTVIATSSNDLDDDMNSTQQQQYNSSTLYINQYDSDNTDNYSSIVGEKLLRQLNKLSSSQQQQQQYNICYISYNVNIVNADDSDVSDDMVIAWVIKQIIKKLNNT